MTFQKSSADRTALLLVGHGTRDPRGQAEFLELARLVAKRLPTMPVRPAYLELAVPDIGMAIDELLATAPIERLLVLPLLLFAAAHAKRDIPQAVDQALARHPGVASRQLPHLGTHPAVVELSARRMKHALIGTKEIPPGETCSVLVGRGSYDADAQAEWREFAARRRESTPLGEWRECFLALAKPTPEELLPQLVAGPWRRFIWQPHLLFQGELSDSVRAFVTAAAAQNPSREWMITSHLGPDASLEDGVAEIVAKEMDS